MSDATAAFDLAAYLTERRQIVDDALDVYLPTAETAVGVETGGPANGRVPVKLYESIRYSIFCGGKRLRPILALAAVEAVGGETAHVMPLACAVESYAPWMTRRSAARISSSGA